LLLVWSGRDRCTINNQSDGIEPGLKAQELLGTRGDIKSLTIGDDPKDPNQDGNQRIRIETREI
jgi:hypothetical protein